MQYAPLRCSVRSPSPHRIKCDNMLLCSSCLEKAKASESDTHCVQAFVPLFFPKWVDGSKRSKQDKQAMEAFVNFMRTRASMDMPSRKRGQEDEAVDEVEVEAAEEDIEIGRVISAQGDDISLEEAFARIRLTQQGT